MGWAPRCIQDLRSIVVPSCNDSLSTWVVELTAQLSSSALICMYSLKRQGKKLKTPFGNHTLSGVSSRTTNGSLDCWEDCRTARLKV
ncbi:hypothetical protein E4T43_08572 [Aureobasidium subglaciale]|nr:hypothetical protein E4T43_08572 [Aureobasidium subglaciale]